MKFHCPLSWELQDGDGKACLIKCTLPFQAQTEWLNVSAQAREKWRASAPHKSQEVETVNAQHGPLTEITPPLYNPMPRLYGGQEVKRELYRSADKQARRVGHVGSFGACDRGCASVSTVGVDRYAICTRVLSHPLSARLSPPITNQHSAAWELSGHSTAPALTCSASRSPLAR